MNDLSGTLFESTGECLTYVLWLGLERHFREKLPYGLGILSDWRFTNPTYVLAQPTVWHVKVGNFLKRQVHSKGSSASEYLLYML